MEIHYSKQAEKFLKKQNREGFWQIILNKYASIRWDDIEEEEPDDIDLQMLRAIEEDPECHEFTRESDIDWD